jgi:putative ubiquitin-RnfH superfamily antitoxin RatB of RatAB toxin-antitoxin module
MANQKDRKIVFFSIGFVTSVLAGALVIAFMGWLPKETIFPPVAGVLAAVTAYVFGVRRDEALDQMRQVRIEKLELKVEEEPEKVKFAWDLARIKLETYFDRNLDQVRMIFFVAVAVMVVGFGFVLWGIQLAIRNPESVKIAIVASASGILTQFIGLTFMAIYRSTMLQATQFMSVLERINTVGMAVQILDSMKDTSSELKDLTRVDIIRLLLASPGTQLSLKARSRKTKSTDGDKTPGI